MNADWRLDAECRGLNPSLFFPERGDVTADIKKVCDRCPVQQECLSFALDTSEVYGIWGGKSERQRRKLRHGRMLTCGRAGCDEMFVRPFVGRQLYCSPTCSAIVHEERRGRRLHR